MAKIDREKLQAGDGREGRAALVAFKGRVYDVTESRLWKEGLHMALHRAGGDLTEHLPMAPHGEEVFDRVDLAGEMSEPVLDQADQRDELKENLTALYHKVHPHPISIHFPIALFIFSSMMNILYLLFGRPDSLASASLYAFMFAAMVAPVAMSTGFLSWWLNYNATLTDTFRKKILGSLLLLFLAVICLAWRLFDPAVPAGSGMWSWVYHGLVISTWPVVAFIGYQGGKISFPG